MFSKEIDRIRAKIWSVETKGLSPEELYACYGIEKEEITTLVLYMLEQSYIEYDASLLEIAINVLFTFKKDLTGDFIKIISVLNCLILCDWHKEHENIAMLLQHFKSPTSVDMLYETALKEYSYLNYDESYALAVKCIWGLGDIRTDKAVDKLELLAESSNEVISKNAKKQIKRIHESGQGGEKNK